MGFVGGNKITNIHRTSEVNVLGCIGQSVYVVAHGCITVCVCLAPLLDATDHILPQILVAKTEY